ncbi:recombinase family protein [Clostridium sp. Ade.TY]|uniref:recombinase family protein n=1 Tax=Clostridium sp. Ade.TY TaxID=1391647 RepID=UPI000403219E|nr:recombinase family protein [Clostridium sp. Ade.TY]
MKKVALYCRVSSDDQKERETIENQVEILNTYVEMKDDLSIYKEYLDDGISGTVAFEERPAGKDLINDAKEGLFDTILVWKIDRFGRDTLSGLSAIETLRKYDIEIMSVTEPFDLNTPTGRFQFITYLNMAELERNNILDRMFLGATRAAKKGKWLGGIVPYGYFVNKDGYLEINDDEAKIIKKIFDMYVNDKSSTLEIALYLNSLNIPTNYSRGKGKGNRTITGKWRQSTILRVLTNTTYIGIHEYGKRGTRRKETIIRNVPQIIDKDLWNKAKELRGHNRSVAKRNTKNVDYLLRGLIKCAKCGRAYQGVSYKNGSLAYYVCATKRGDRKKILGEKCDNLNVPKNELENAIWDMIKNDILLNVDEIINNVTISLNKDTKLNSVEKDLEKIECKIKNVDNEKSKILNLYRKDLLTDDDVEKELEKINIEKETLNELYRKIEKKYSIENNVNNITDNFRDLMKKYSTNLDKIDFNKKKEIINFLIESIEIDYVKKGLDKIITPKINFKFPVGKNFKYDLDVDDDLDENAKLINLNKSTFKLAWTRIVGSYKLKVTFHL